MADINLLPEEERSAESFENLRRKLLMGSVGALVVTGVLTLLLLIYYTVVSSKKAGLISKVEASTQTIQSFQANEELIVVTKGKVTDAAKILKARPDLYNFFNEFSQLVPQNMYFSDFKIGDGKLTASGKAGNSSAMASFVSALVSSTGQQLVSNVNVESLSSDEAGAYDFVINMKLKSKGQS
jgi:Tfp pilus assembly protein PilN